MQSFRIVKLMPMLAVIQDSVMSSESCLWTWFGVEQADTRSACASIWVLSEIIDNRQNVLIASKHSLVGSNSVVLLALKSERQQSAFQPDLFLPLFCECLRCLRCLRLWIVLCALLDP